MDLSQEDVQNILKIIDSSSLEELHLEIGDFKLVVRKRGAGRASQDGPVGPAAVEAAPAGGAAAEPLAGHDRPAAAPAVEPPRGAVQPASPRPTPAVAGGFELKAPMVGTFYRAPAPGAPPFVEEGSVVGEDDTVCIIDVMKLMNSIKAGRRGRVVAILVEDGALVEYGQPLMILAPLDATPS
jgi:acetyl-CoA carboxylase biotin carboxyl carrier protein